MLSDRHVAVLKALIDYGDYADYTDYGDDDDDTGASSNGVNRHERAPSQGILGSDPPHEGVAEMQQDGEHDETTVISVINRNHCNQSAASRLQETTQSGNHEGLLFMMPPMRFLRKSR